MRDFNSKQPNDPTMGSYVIIASNTVSPLPRRNTSIMASSSALFVERHVFIVTWLSTYSPCVLNFSTVSVM